MWLTKEDVDLKRRLIHVRAKTIEGRFRQPKTKHNRVVPISKALMTILTQYSSKCDGPWFFPSPTGKRWDPDNFSQTLRETNRKHGLEWSCLDFRHTFGSHLAIKGESLYKISTLMGNSPDICRKHYAALIPEQMQDHFCSGVYIIRLQLGPLWLYWFPYVEAHVELQSHVPLEIQWALWEQG